MCLADLRPAVAAHDAERFGATAWPGAADVTDHGALRQLVRWALDHAVDGFVLASGMGPSTAFGESPDSWRRVFDVNLWGASNFISAIAAERDDRALSVVLISSINAKLPVPGYGAYCASKAGVDMLVQIASQDLAPSVRVNAVAPGPLEAAHGVHAAFPALRDRLRKHHLIEERLTTGRDVGAMVDFMLSPAAAWITGVSVAVDGGVRLPHPNFRQL